MVEEVRKEHYLKHLLVVIRFIVMYFKSCLFKNFAVETFLKRRQIGLHACNTRKENEESCDEAQEKKEDQNCCDENKIGDDDDGDNGGDDNAGGEGKARPSDNVCPQMSDQDAGYIVCLKNPL